MREELLKIIDVSISENSFIYKPKFHTRWDSNWRLHGRSKLSNLRGDYVPNSSGSPGRSKRFASIAEYSSQQRCQCKSHARDADVETPFMAEWSCECWRSFVPDIRRIILPTQGYQVLTTHLASDADEGLFLVASTSERHSVLMLINCLIVKQ